MKLEDKTIEQITAIFDKEIAELEKEIKAAAEDALKTVGAEAESLADGEAPVADEALEEPVATEPVADKPAENPDATDQVAEPASETESDLVEDQVPDPESDLIEDQVVAEEPEVEEEAKVEEEPEMEEEPETDESASEDPPVVPSEHTKSSAAKNILGAAGYLLAVAAICILSVLCVNLIDKNIQRLKPVIPPDIPQANLASSLQAYTANEVIDQEGIKQPSLEQIYAMDLRKPSGATEADLKKVSKAGLVGLEDTFLEAEKKYGVNAIFLMSIASLESAHGTMMYRPNNMFGYGGKSYPSKEACIMDVASGLSSRYLKPGGSLYGGSPTLKGVNKRYAANPQWYAKVGKYMKSYYDVIAPYHNQSLDKIR